MVNDDVFDRARAELRDTCVDSDHGFFLMMYHMHGNAMQTRVAGGLSAAGAASMIREMIDRFGPEIVLDALQICRSDRVEIGEPLDSEKQSWPDLVGE